MRRRVIRLGRRVIRMLRGSTSALEVDIGYSFRSKHRLASGLIHPSYRFEKEGVEQDNERLEFLGDAVLGFVSAAYIYERFADKEEGALTALRSGITSGKALAEIAASIGLGAQIKLGRGEEISGGRRRASCLADALEAVIGAAYLDGGVKAVENIFAKLFVPLLDARSGDFWADNPKGQLQDVAQRVLKAPLRYRIVGEDGPAHRRIFTVEVTVGSTVLGVGTGPNKRQAEVHAASRALESLLASGVLNPHKRSL